MYDIWRTSLALLLHNTVLRKVFNGLKTNLKAKRTVRTSAHFHSRIKRLLKQPRDIENGYLSCNTYDKGGQKDFEEFVCCVTQHKFYNSH